MVYSPPVTTMPVQPTGAYCPPSAHPLLPTMSPSIAKLTSGDGALRGDPSLFCNYFKKKGHSKETCLKLQKKNVSQGHFAGAVIVSSSPSTATAIVPPVPLHLLPQPSVHTTAPPSRCYLRPDELEPL